MLLQQNAFKTILKTSLLAGTLDGIAAALLYSIPSGKDPLNVYRFIASGVFGNEAFEGGVPMALLGILFHYIIAMGWTVLFFAAYPRIALLSKNKIIAGVCYGIFVWLMMNLVVVPLSSVPMKGSRELSSIIIGMAVLIFCIGLPISWMASKYFSMRK